MLRTPPPGDWLMMRRNYQAWSHSPLDRDHDRQRRTLRLAWVWAMNEGGANQPMPLVHDGIIYLDQHDERGAGARRRHRRSDLGEPGRPEPPGTASARCATWRSTATSCTSRRPTLGSSRSTRAPAQTVWDDDRRRPREGLLEHERADRGQGQGDPGAAGLRSLPRGAVLHQRLRRRNRQARVEVSHRRPERRAGRRHLGQAARHDAPGRRDVDRRQLRSRCRPHVLGHRAGQAMDAGEPRHARLRRRAAHRINRGARSGRRRAGLALPAHARRVTRPRRGLRARARSTSAPQKALFTIGKSGMLWKLESPDRHVPRPHRDGLPERLHRHRSEDRRAHLSRRHPRAEDRSVDSGLPEHRGRPQLAGDELSPRHALAGHSAQPVVHGDRAAQGGTGAGPGRDGRRAGASSRCPGPTATSASWPPTTSPR